MSSEAFQVSDEGQAIRISAFIEIPSGARSNLESLAAADGRTLASWLSWWLNEYLDDVAELRERINWRCAMSRVELAAEIIIMATSEGWSPWGGPCTHPPKGTTVDQARRSIEEWGTPEEGDADGTGRITPEEAEWMRELGMAALELDGKRAKEIGERLDRAWYVPPKVRGSKKDAPPQSSTAKGD